MGFGKGDRISDQTDRQSKKLVGKRKICYYKREKEKGVALMKELNRSLMLSSIPCWMISFLLPIGCENLGFSPVQITGMFAVCSLFLLLLKPLVGVLCDRWGKKRFFVLGIFLTALSYLLLACSDRIELFYLSQTVRGIASACLSVCTYAILADRVGEAMAVNRGKQFSAQNQGGLYGVLLYFLLAAFLSFAQSWLCFFAVSAGFALVGGIFAGNHLPKEEEKAKQTLQLRVTLKKETIHFIVVRFFFSLSLNVLGAVIVLIMLERFGNNMMEVGLICMLPSCLLTYFMPRIGKTVKKAGEGKAFFLASGFLALFLLLMAGSRKTLWFGLFWSGYQFAVTAAQLALDDLFSLQTEQQNRGLLSGIYSCSVDLGSVIACLSGGIVMQYFGVQAPFYLTAALLACTSAIFLSWQRSGNPKKECKKV